jgi:methyl-accepting chemotaxis protein
MSAPHPLTLGTAEAILENHFRLDEAIDNSLNVVISDTETSALNIIQQVRKLYDSASLLVTYLDGTSQQVGTLSQELQESAAFLSNIGAFIDLLPAKMERDLESVKLVAAEIRELGGLVQDVQSISTQSHMLSINAAIEASRVGAVGGPFGVLAGEMRALAGNSRAMAARIQHGLVRARRVVEEGVASSIADSSRQLVELSQVAGCIEKLRTNLDDMSQYSKTRFSIVTKHNEDLAKDIAEVLGHIQYQDVVRQCIDRIRGVIDQRNTLLQSLTGMADADSIDLEGVPRQLDLILSDYLTEENKHMHSARDVPESGAAPKLELF